MQNQKRHKNIRQFLFFIEQQVLTASNPGRLNQGKTFHQKTINKKIYIRVKTGTSSKKFKLQGGKGKK